jgi:hypothetical protein
MSHGFRSGPQKRWPGDRTHGPQDLSGVIALLLVVVVLGTLVYLFP